MNKLLHNNPYFHIRNISIIPTEGKKVFLYKVNVQLHSTKIAIMNSINFIFNIKPISINTKIEKYPVLVNKIKRKYELHKEKIALVKTDIEIPLSNFLSLFGGIKNIAESERSEDEIDKMIDKNDEK